MILTKLFFFWDRRINVIFDHPMTQQFEQARRESDLFARLARTCSAAGVRRPEGDGTDLHERAVEGGRGLSLV